MRYFVWFDDTPKKLAEDKLQEAIAAYVGRFHFVPKLVLANVADQVQRTDVVIRYEQTVQPNSFWLGYESQGELPQRA